jgi:hypothetical protein
MKKIILFLASLLVFATCAMSQFQHDLKPMFADTLLFEDWSSGSVDTNRWYYPPWDTVSLTVSTVEGNPPPSAQGACRLGIGFDFSLTSKQLLGTGMYTELRYDFQFIFSNNEPVQFVAEIFDGNTWHPVDINESEVPLPWTSRIVDISEYCHNNFNIRFRGISGLCSVSDHLNIDNILVSSSPLGIPEHQNADLIIKPNPAHSSLDLVLKNFENQKTQMILLDVTGKAVYEEEFIPGTKEYLKKVNIDNLSQGIYFCEIKSNQKKLIRKVIVE